MKKSIVFPPTASANWTNGRWFTANNRGQNRTKKRQEDFLEKRVTRVSKLHTYIWKKAIEKGKKHFKKSIADRKRVFGKQRTERVAIFRFANQPKRKKFYWRRTDTENRTIKRREVNKQERRGKAANDETNIEKYAKRLTKKEEQVRWPTNTDTHRIRRTMTSLQGHRWATISNRKIEKKNGHKKKRGRMLKRSVVGYVKL